MHLDIRIPIGLLFVVIGSILAGYGLLNPPAAGTVNIDLGWGLIQFAFGALMLWIARRSSSGKN